MTLRRHLLALDQGTTSSRAIVFDQTLQPIAVAQRELRQIHPHPAWVEHDPLEIWHGQRDVARQALQQAGLTLSDIAGVGITNQRETVVGWDRETGTPVGNAIVWQCRRTAPLCEELRAKELEPLYRQRTGLVLDAYFSGTKIAWLLRNNMQAARLAQAGRLAVGTVDSWLLWKLTGGSVHATDPSNASRTLLFDLHTGSWSRELADQMEIPMEILPTVMASAGEFGQIADGVLGPGTAPVTGVAGDQQAALFGQGCFHPGLAKNTYGTGCFLLLYTADVPKTSDAGLLTTVAWDIGGGLRYALEGSVFTGGAAVQWLRDKVGLIETAAQSEVIARTVNSTEGAYFVPALTGLGAPHWEMEARGTFVGISPATGRAHLVRATLESMAYQSLDLVRAMERDATTPVRELRVDGGAAANDFLMQFQADLLGLPVRRPAHIESTALGAAALAGLGSGLFTDEKEISDKLRAGDTFTPRMPPDEAARHLAGWKRAVDAALYWAHTEKATP